MKKRYYYLVIAILLASCTTLAKVHLTNVFDTPNPARFDHPKSVSAPVSYQNEVRPILEKRCVVCHACYDAPCQLKLGSYEGITRGASKEPVYNGTRLLPANPTRLFIDANSPSEWRGKGFFPVLNEFDRTPDEKQASILARALALKDGHVLPENEPAPADMDFSLDRKNQCPSIEEYSAFEQKNPQMGMPFGLPAISKKERKTLELWLENGAPYDAPASLPETIQTQVQVWETFFNKPGLREQLVSRYIYEHLFLANLYFEDTSPLHYFRMVRSSTPPGLPVNEIPSRSPVEDPGIARVYYRLQPVVESIVAKSHMPYSLSTQRMMRWTELFFEPEYTIDTLPGYDPEVIKNPLKAFEAIPVKSRYKFMLDEAEFSIMGFIKGPVCRGQTALNVINDHFWVFFISPEFIDDAYGNFLKQKSELLDLPAEQTHSLGLVLPLLRSAREEKEFLLEKSDYLEKRFTGDGTINLDLIWDGDQKNPNAALTIYRHFDNATVLKGLVGEKPKTAWVINYSILERIHYLLSAGYDVFGNVGHQVNTRLYMDYLRTEGEFNFISLLPKASRLEVRDYWYRNTKPKIKELVYGKYAHLDRETDIPFSGHARPEHELMDMLEKRLHPILNRSYDIDTEPDIQLRNDLQKLAELQGENLQWLPEAIFLRIESPEKPALNFSILRNTAHFNITHLITEEKTLVPAENSLDVLKGFATAYPNAFYRMQRKDLPEFIRQVSSLNNNESYAQLASRFGVRRTSLDFWKINDAFNADYQNTYPVQAGIFDLNHLENR